MPCTCTFQNRNEGDTNVTPPVGGFTKAKVNLRGY